MIRLSQKIGNWKLALQHKAFNAFCQGQIPIHMQTSQSQYPQSFIGSLVYAPRSQGKELLTEEEVEKQARSIFEWAKSKGAERYSFICYPHTNGIFQKHDSFLNLEYSMDRRGFKQTVSFEFQGNTLIKNECDGSGTPTGNLRQTHLARAYMLWDNHSSLYVRRRNNTLYIPALLVSHDGKALGMKTLFRMSERALEKSTVQLLTRLGVEATGAKMFLGLQQEFFVVPKAVLQKREDLKWLGRALVGTNPARNQQLGEHYYAKMPHVIENVLAQVEQELVEIGIPFKTRHNEDAINQFQVICIYSETGTTIDQNVLAMQIMTQAFDRHGLAVLFHEKPFRHLNGSGKHANWNLGYFKKDGSIKNLFRPLDHQTPAEIELFKLFIMIQVMAVQKYDKLYMASIANPGNEVRLGHREAPPRIFSVCLGETLTNLLEGKPAPKATNLRDTVRTINFDAITEGSDRNRTSPFAHTGKVFEFRGLGSSQNAAYPMAVIAATMAAQIQEVLKLLDSGKSVKDIIAKYVQQTKKIRFEGDGYSQEWKEEAKRRGLYINEKFSDFYSFLDTEQEIFTKIGVTTPEENASRAEVAKSRYMTVAQIEVDTLIHIARRNIIPHGFAYLKTITGDLQSAVFDNYYKDIKSKLEKAISEIEKLQQLKKTNSNTLKGCQTLRDEVRRIGEVITDLITVLPKNPDFPDQSQFLHL